MMYRNYGPKDYERLIKELQMKSYSIRITGKDDAKRIANHLSRQGFIKIVDIEWMESPEYKYPVLNIVYEMQTEDHA